jgi:hypothetical protein
VHAEDTGDQLLGGRLTVRARHRDDRNREAPAVIRGEKTERARRVLDQHQRYIGRHVVVERVHHQAGRAPGGRVGEERVTVEPIAADREEGFADAERSRIDGHARDRHTEIARDEGALRRSHDVLNGE